MKRRQPTEAPAVPNLPVTYQSQWRDAQASFNEANKLLRTAEETWKKAEAARFQAAGGCAHCNGRGWVVTWDTLDHMDGSDATYGPCPEEGCTKESRARTGLNLAQENSKYFRWHPVSSKSDMSLGELRRADAMYKVMVLPFQPAVDALNKLTNDLSYFCRDVKLGQKVVVVKGRKAPIGHVGVVAYAKDDGGILIKAEHEWKDRKANGVWTYASNVEIVINPQPSQTR